MLNTIEIIGGTKEQKRIAQKVAEFCFKELLPRVRTCYLELKICDIKSDAVGFCMMGNDNREFEMEIDKKQSLKDFVTSICHEMVHVKQYYRKEIDPYGTRWKAARISTDTNYWDLPWEKEAYKMQDTLALQCWEQNIL